MPKSTHTKEINALLAAVKPVSAHEKKINKIKQHFKLFSQTQHDKKKGGKNLSVDDLILCVPVRNFTGSYSCLSIKKTEGENGKSPENSKNDLERLIRSELK